MIEALFLNNNSTAATIVHTPATAYLPIDEEGEPGIDIYNYASVVGMLNYLQGHSHVDITFAVSQVARYVHAPKRSHELALEHICRYLKPKEIKIIHCSTKDQKADVLTKPLTQAVFESC